LSYPVFFLYQKNYRSDTKQKLKNLAHGFSCLNGREAAHRLLLGFFLHQRNLLNQIIYTQRLESVQKIDPWYPEYEKLLNMPGFSDFLYRVLPKQIGDGYWNDHSVNHIAYTDAYCNIVTETEIDYGYEIITEKSSKPFIAYQIPLMYAGKGHIQFLKSLGLEVMMDLYPPDYDFLDSTSKADAICNIVSKGSDFIENFYFNHAPELEYNHNLILSDKIENLILQNIKNIIT
jgi:hypothetical protein